MKKVRLVLLLEPAQALHLIQLVPLVPPSTLLLLVPGLDQAQAQALALALFQQLRDLVLPWQSVPLDLAQVLLRPTPLSLHQWAHCLLHPRSEHQVK